MLAFWIDAKEASKDRVRKETANYKDDYEVILAITESFFCFGVALR
jgi:hypothetical protein